MLLVLLNGDNNYEPQCYERPETRAGKTHSLAMLSSAASPIHVLSPVLQCCTSNKHFTTTYSTCIHTPTLSHTHMHTHTHIPVSANHVASSFATVTGSLTVVQRPRVSSGVVSTHCYCAAGLPPPPRRNPTPSSPAWPGAGKPNCTVIGMCSTYEDSN